MTNETRPTDQIHNTDELPSDGCITVKGWDRSRRRGWHLEHQIYAREDGTYAMYLATPMNIGTGRVTGSARKIHLAFTLDAIEEMPR